MHLTFQNEALSPSSLLNPKAVCSFPVLCIPPSPSPLAPSSPASSPTLNLIPHPPAIPAPLPSPLQLGDIARGPLKKRPKVVNVDVLSNVSGYLMPGAFTLILGEMGIRVLCGGLQRCLPKSD